MLQCESKFTNFPNSTVWKFQDFSATLILREINFRESKSSKTAIFALLESLNFDFYEFWHFWRFKLTKFRAPKVAKISVLELLDSPKLISRKFLVTEISWLFHTVHTHSVKSSKTKESNNFETNLMEFLHLKNYTFNKQELNYQGYFNCWFPIKTGIIHQLLTFLRYWNDLINCSDFFNESTFNTKWSKWFTKENMI